MQTISSDSLYNVDGVTLSDGEWEQAGIFTQRSGVTCYAKHDVTIALPVSITGETVTNFYSGTVARVNFYTAELDVQTDKPVKSIRIHQTAYPFPSELQSYLQSGREAFLASTVSGKSKKKVIGSETCEPPVIVVMESIVFTPSSIKAKSKMGSKAPVSDNKTIWKQISDNLLQTGLNLEFTEFENGSFTVTIPAKYIVQDKTTVLAEDETLKEKGTPLLTRPTAFPDLGSIVTFSTPDGYKCGMVTDFGVVESEDPEIGPIVEAEIKLPSGQLVTHNLHRLYAEKIEDFRDPNVKLFARPREFKKFAESIRQGVLEEISVRMSKFQIWVPGKGQLSVLAMDVGAKERTTSWITVDKIHSEDDCNGLTLTSFEGGEVKLEDETILPVFYRYSRNPNAAIPEDPEVDYIELQDKLPTGAKFISLRFNAAMGCLRLNGKTSERYFSTNNDQPIEVTPVFQRRARTGRVFVDIIQDKIFIGEAGKSSNPSHRSQDVVYWMAISPAYLKFYELMTSENPEQFFKKPANAGKSLDERRAMFTCRKFPYLVELYNFIVDGLSERNPTRDSTYTQRMLQSFLNVDYDLFMEHIFPKGQQ